MTQRNKRLKNWTIAFLAVVALGFTTSCEEDNLLTGTEIIGDGNLISDPDATATVVAFSEQLKSIQTNTQESQRSGVLGVHKNPVFGKTTMNLLAQLRLSRINPSFTEEDIRVDSVKLHLPYYSRTVVDVDTTYVIDSVLTSGAMKIEVFESRYFLRERDPSTNFEDAQAYYSDQIASFEGNLGTKIGEVNNFYPSAQPIVHVLDEDVEVAEGEEPKKKKEIWEPGVYMDLSTEFFQSKIIDKGGSGSLVSNESFAEYFRGVYFKVTENNDSGSMFLFKMDASVIRIYYSSPSAEDSVGERVKKTFDLSFSGGTKVETIEKLNSGFVEQQMAIQDSVNGSSRLLLQGGGAIVSVVKLFGDDLDGNGVADELELLRERKPIINEANLVLYVDQDALLSSGESEPERIIIFNANNGRVLVDYSMDQTASANTLNSKLIHLGRLQRGDDKKGISYKLRITNFVSDLINNPEMKNIPLAIAVIPNVEVGAPIKIKEDMAGVVKGVPSGILFSPKSTVIHGSNSENIEKRLKLEMYFTDVK